MAHQVPWNKYILERFIEDAALSKEEELIIRTRVLGWSRVKQAEELGMSLSTVDRTIKRLKAKYDVAQQYDKLLPKRKWSYEETYACSKGEKYERE